jgi:hypothetical protein
MDITIYLKDDRVRTTSGTPQEPDEVLGVYPDIVETGLKDSQGRNLGRIIPRIVYYWRHELKVVEGKEVGAGFYRRDEARWPDGDILDLYYKLEQKHNKV